MAEPIRVPSGLTGVPETLLWTLYYRAQEAAPPDAALRDPLAVELVSLIDYPFEQRLGKGASRAQWQGLRSRTFDGQVRTFLARHPGGTVVALGEGLETAFWRCRSAARCPRRPCRGPWTVARRRRCGHCRGCARSSACTLHAVGACSTDSCCPRWSARPSWTP